MNTSTEKFEEWLQEIKKMPSSMWPFNPIRFHPIPTNIVAPFNDQRDVFGHRMRQIRPMFLKDRSIEIHLDFVDDGACNAVASTYDSMGIVAVTKGGILLPFEMFYRIFSHPLVLQGIGDPAKEVVGPQHKEGIPTDYDELIRRREMAGISHLPPRPIDPIRASVAQICIDLSWGFLVMHELTHILHGHVAYLGQRQSNPVRFIAEALSLNSGTLPQEDLDRQALELWADSKAISVVLGGLLSKSEGPNLNELFPEPQDKLFIWSFALFIFFRIWGFEIDPANLGGSHPPTALRFEMAMHGARSEVVSRFPHIGSELLWQAIHSGQRLAEEAVVHCGGDPLLPADIIGTRHPLTNSHMDRLDDHFDKVLSTELKKHAFVPL